MNEDFARRIAEVVILFAMVLVAVVVAAVAFRVFDWIAP